MFPSSNPGRAFQQQIQARQRQIQQQVQARRLAGGYYYQQQRLAQQRLAQQRLNQQKSKKRNGIDTIVKKYDNNSLENLYESSKKSELLRKKQTLNSDYRVCSVCSGKGYIPEHDCPFCNGSGKRWLFFNCNECNGNGRIHEHKCWLCHGSGKIHKSPCINHLKSLPY